MVRFDDSDDEGHENNRRIYKYAKNENQSVPMRDSTKHSPSFKQRYNEEEEEYGDGDNRPKTVEYAGLIFHRIDLGSSNSL